MAKIYEQRVPPIAGEVGDHVRCAIAPGVVVTGIIVAREDAVVTLLLTAA